MATYKPPAIRFPSMKQMSAVASRTGFDIPEDELKEYKELISENIPCITSLDDLIEPTLPIKYPRTPGYKPTKEENPHNAWIRKTDIVGATEGKLLGKTMAVKDCIAVCGVEMTAGSRLLEGFVPDYDATVVTRVLDAGAHLVGKSNCEEFCYSGCSFTSAHGAVQNPNKFGFSAGGSSCGNGALLAAGDVDMAIGTDQGGSVRLPASFCGIIGLKPTRGLVPYTGIISMDASIDHVGPMTRTVRDCALLLEVMAGNDGLDHRQPTIVQVPEYIAMLTTDLNGVKIGVLAEGFHGCDKDVEDIVRREVSRFSDWGATVEPVSIPMHTYGEHMMIAIGHYGFYETVTSYGCSIGTKGFHSANTFDAFKNGWNSPKRNNIAPTVKLQCLLAEYIKDQCGPRYYAKGQNLARTLAAKYDDALRKYDVIVMPTILYKAHPLPTTGVSVTEYVHTALHLIANTGPFDVTGHPALSINAGFSEDLPVGLMIVGKHFDESTVLKVAYTYEQLSQ